MEQFSSPDDGKNTEKNNRLVTRRDIAEAILKVSLSEEVSNVLFTDTRSKPTILYDIIHFIEAVHYKIYRKEPSLRKEGDKRVTLDKDQTRFLLEKLIKTKISRNTERKLLGYNIVLNEELVQRVLLYLFGSYSDQEEM